MQIYANARRCENISQMILKIEEYFDTDKDD